MTEVVGTPGPMAPQSGKPGHRRPSPAARARIITAGVATTAAFVMVAGMALPGGGSAAATPPDQAGVTGSSSSVDGGARAAASGAVPSTPAAAPVTSSSGS